MSVIELIKEGIIKVDTGDTGQVEQIYLLEEVARAKELSRQLKARMRDVFVKEESEISSGKDEAPPANPIDYAIAISQDTQHILKGCLELLEHEIIAKLVGR